MTLVDRPFTRKGKRCPLDFKQAFCMFSLCTICTATSSPGLSVWAARSQAEIICGRKILDLRRFNSTTTCLKNVCGGGKLDNTPSRYSSYVAGHCECFLMLYNWSRNGEMVV